MRSISVALAAHLATDSTTLATCWKVTLANGAIHGFTDHDSDVVFDSVTYASAVSYKASDIASASDLSVDNLELLGLLNSPSITKDDLLAGLWDFAAIEIFLVNYADLTMGRMIERVGKIGEVTLERGQFRAEFRGLSQAYSRSVGRLEGPACNANLGDSRCKVRLSPPVWTPTTSYGPVQPGDASLASIVSPTTPNGRIFACTTGGSSGSSEPSWNLTIDATTSDGTVVWTTRSALKVFGSIDDASSDGLTIYASDRTEAGPTEERAVTGVSNANPGVVSFASAFDTPLAEGEAVVLSDIVGPATLNTTTVAHNPGATSFELSVDTSDTVDYPPWTSGGKVTRLGDSGFFDGGVLTITGPSTSQNIGISREVKTYVPGQLTLQLPFPYPISSGDEYELTAGCDKSLATCRDRFGNLQNMRAFPYLPGTDKIVQVGRHNG